MNETSALLHNMSSPPKSVIKYAGLSNIGRAEEAKERGNKAGAFGTFISFRLPQSLCRMSPKSILKQLEVDVVGDPKEFLLSLIETRARELPLPEACLVVPTNSAHPSPLPDLLSALAVITKSSQSIWLRDKSPRLSALKRMGQISLLVPPGFTENIKVLKK
jgi:hypothetical protein